MSATALFSLAMLSGDGRGDSTTADVVSLLKLLLLLLERRGLFGTVLVLEITEDDSLLKINHSYQTL